MWVFLRFFVLVAVVAAGVVTAEFCVENGDFYPIVPGDTLYGYINSPEGAMCRNSSLVALSQVPPPSLLLLLGSGWKYFFSAMAEGPFPVIVNFTLSARCDGVEICRANIYFEIDPAALTNGSSVQKRVTTATEKITTRLPIYPPCAASPEEYQLLMLPGRPQIATLATSAIQVECPNVYLVSITQPKIGSAALIGLNSLQFVYSSFSDDLDLNITLPYEVACGKNPICAGEMQIWIHQTVPQCPENHMLYDVKPGAQANTSLDTSVSCDGNLRGRVRSQSDGGTFKFVNGLFFVFNAPEKEEDVVVNARLYCDDQIVCDLTFAFVVSNKSRPKPTETPISNATVTPSLAPVAMCKEQFNLAVPTGKTLQGKLHVNVQGCSLVTYHQPSYHPLTGLQVNIIGDFFYTAPAKETVDVLPVDVLCITEFRCRTHLIITSYSVLPIKPSSTNSSTTPTPIPVCANVYYYQTAPGVALSGSLNGMPGQDPCVYGRYFSIINPPKEGKVELTLAGDFLYSPGRHEGAYDFSFNMYCLNKLRCQGNAYLLVSNTWTLPPGRDDHESSSTTTPPPLLQSEIANKQIKCRGTCNEKAWKTYPGNAMWDNTPGSGYARRDGHAVDELQVDWANNSLIITVYTIIGNLGVRFPTFEPFDRMVGKYFEPKDFEGVVKSTSLGFELSCLAHQGISGLGEDVWRWKTLGNGTGMGSVGVLYNKDTSWYQKFGGKHVECDTFLDSCRYAPLLTPSVSKAGAVGRWEIEINDCDATWTGTFSYASLKQLKKSDGSPVWSFVGNKKIKGTIVSEGVRANSWIEPAHSFDTQHNVHNIVLDLQQFVVVNKLTEAPFCIDSEFFEYTDNGDLAFGVNLLLHPYVTKDMETSYAEDRHVFGFKWITQNWVAPSAEQCLTCRGNQSHCKADNKYNISTYTSEFLSGDCLEGRSRVELRKGPVMNIVCPPDPMHVYNRSGFSTPSDCATWYQNLTIRGVITGSAALPEAIKRSFSYEGRVVLQLLMTDGATHDVAIDFSMYVTSFSQDLNVTAGRLGICRSSKYWPVLDPLGSSLSDKPFRLSTASPGPLCVDSLSSTFGPGGWAVVFLQLPDVHMSQVNVHYIVVNYNGQNVYLLYQDPVSKTPTIPPESVGYWWRYTHPFLCFRDLTYRVVNGNLTTGSLVNSLEVTNVTFAFAFIPGNINVATNMEISIKATITTEIPRTRIFRRMIRLDPMMTQRSRYGPPKKTETKVEDLNEKKNAVAVGALAGLSIVVTITGIVYITMDTKRPLPKWVPRGKLIKNAMLAVVPINLRITRKEKRIVHKDMYDAMKSGMY